MYEHTFTHVRTHITGAEDKCKIHYDVCTEMLTRHTGINADNPIDLSYTAHMLSSVSLPCLWVLERSTID